MTKSLAIVTVVYNNYQILTDFFQGLKKQTNRDFRLFLVDLSDKKKPILIKDFPCEIITGKNRGYAYGVNIGLKKAKKMGFDHFCIINSDTFFEAGFVTSVTQALDHRPGSIIGGKIYYAPGSEYHREKYLAHDRGKIIWYAGGSVDWNHVFTPHQGVDQLDIHQFDKTTSTDFITGCLMCLDSTVIDYLDYWDEKYFLYFEDADYCERAKRKGINLYYEPSICIWHKNAQSTEGPGSKIHQYYQKTSQLRFGLKYAPLRTKFHLIKNYFLSM